jgi:hypothetical protein
VTLKREDPYGIEDADVRGMIRERLDELQIDAESQWHWAKDYLSSNPYAWVIEMMLEVAEPRDPVLTEKLNRLKQVCAELAEYIQKREESK